MAAVSACSFWASAFNRSKDWLAATYFGSACGLPSFFLAHAWIDMAPEVTSNDKITTFERDTRRMIPPSRCGVTAAASRTEEL